MSGPVELHTPEAHDVITCELVACTLGQRRRIELRVDFAGQFARIAQAYDEFQRQVGAALIAALRRLP